MSAGELPPALEAIVLDELPGYWGPDSAAADLGRRIARRAYDLATPPPAAEPAGAGGELPAEVQEIANEEMRRYYQHRDTGEMTAGDLATSVARRVIAHCAVAPVEAPVPAAPADEMGEIVEHLLRRADELERHGRNSVSGNITVGAPQAIRLAADIRALLARPAAPVVDREALLFAIVNLAASPQNEEVGSDEWHRLEKNARAILDRHLASPAPAASDEATARLREAQAAYQANIAPRCLAVYEDGSRCVRAEGHAGYHQAQDGEAFQTVDHYLPRESEPVAQVPSLALDEIERLKKENEEAAHEYLRQYGRLKAAANRSHDACDLLVSALRRVIEAEVDALKTGGWTNGARVAAEKLLASLPEEVDAAVRERESLRAEVERLRGEVATAREAGRQEVLAKLEAHVAERRENRDRWEREVKRVEGMRGHEQVLLNMAELALAAAKGVTP